MVAQITFGVSPFSCFEFVALSRCESRGTLVGLPVLVCPCWRRETVAKPGPLTGYRVGETAKPRRSADDPTCCSRCAQPPQHSKCECKAYAAPHQRYTERRDQPCRQLFRLARHASART